MPLGVARCLSTRLPHAADVCSSCACARLCHAPADVNVLYLFEAQPPFAVVRVSMPFTLPSCVHGRLHMLIQVAKSLVEVDDGYLLCWGELDCYSCCATLPRSLVAELLHLPPAR